MNKPEQTALIERANRLITADGRENVACYIGDALLVTRDGLVMSAPPFATKAEVFAMLHEALGKTGTPLITA